MSIWKENLQQYQEKHKQLISYASSAVNIAKECGTKRCNDTLAELFQRAQDESFRVLVLGEFKRGKSTLLNAMLGRPILPAKVAPCSAVITEVHYAEEPKAILYHKKKGKGGNGASPEEVDINDLNAYLVIPKNAISGNDASKHQTPYEKMELFYPLDLCKEGVILIDSPGLNEDPARTEETEKYLKKTDAILFVVSCDAFLSGSEIEALARYLRGREGILFVAANRYDSVRGSPDDIEDLKDRERQILHPILDEGRVKDPQSRIHYVSAKEALEAQKTSNEELLGQSQFPVFLDSLANFLTQDRGRIKLGVGALHLHRTLCELNSEISTSLENLFAPLSDLESRLKLSQDELANAEKEKSAILTKIDRKKSLMLRQADAMISSFLPSIMEKADEELSQFEPEAAFLKAKAYTEECVKFVDTSVKKQIDQWQKEDFEPFLTEMYDGLREDLENRASEFLDNIEKAQNFLAGRDVVNIQGEFEQESVSSLERILAAAGGFVFFGAGSAVVGGTLGFSEMLKTGVFHLAAVMGMVMLGVTNPLTIIPVLLGLGVLQLFIGKEGLKGKFKKKVIESIKDEVYKKHPEIKQQLVKSIEDLFGELFGSVEKGLDGYLSSIREQMNNAKMALQAGQTEKEENKIKLSRLKTQNNELIKNIFDFHHLVYQN